METELVRHVLPELVAVIASYARSSWLLAVTLGGREVEVVDAMTGATLTRVRHRHDVHAVALSLDLRTLAAGTRNGTVKLWDLASGRSRGTLRTNAAHHPVCEMLFTHGSSCMLTSWSDSTRQNRDLRFWNLDTGLYRELSEDVWHVTLCGQRLIQSSRVGPYEVRCAQTGARVGDVVKPPEPLGYYVFAPHGRQALNLIEKRIWHVSSSQHGAQLEGTTRDEALHAVTFSPDGCLLAAAPYPSYAGRVRCWDTCTGRLVRVYNTYANSLLQFSHDGVRLAGMHAHYVEVWNVHDGQSRWALTVDYSDRVRTVKFAPADSELLLVHLQCSLELWHWPTNTRRLQRVWPSAIHYTCIT